MNDLQLLKEKIKSKCLEWADKNLSMIDSTFTFREHQLEAIVSIIYNILNYDENIKDNENDSSNNIFNRIKRHQCIEAPTGSGKSIMLIVAASVLSEYYNKDSYILCSDLSLFKQYEDFINKMNLTHIGYIKGQTGNYHCDFSDCEYRNAPCKIKKVSYNTLFNDITSRGVGFPCAKKCGYILDRKRASNAHVIITTYQNYLYSVATKEGKRNNSLKNTHEILFCDECHNIPNIVQGKFTPTVSYDLLKHIEQTYNFIINNKNVQFKDYIGNNTTFAILYNLKRKTTKHTEKVVKEYKKLIDYIIDYKINKNNKKSYINIYNKIIELEEQLSFFYNVSKNIQLYIKEQVEKELIPDYNKWREYYAETNYWSNYMCYLHDFMTAIDETDFNYIIKTPIEYKDTNYNNTYKGCNLQCAREDVIIQKHIFDTCNHIVMTSATIGSKSTICENFGTTNIEFINIPSTFDFNNCPIYVNPRNKLNYTNKAKSLPNILRQVEQILDGYNSVHGIIQTGNYEVMNYVINNINEKYKKRLLYYNNTSEKREILETFKNNSNSVLIGPSLFEGIDLPDDLCRFIIIMKVPFPCLGDELVQRKIELFPTWYNSQTSNYIIQGIGRGVRNKTDWAHTYILDGCFSYLYNITKRQYSSELQKRIKFI